MFFGTDSDSDANSDPHPIDIGSVISATLFVSDKYAACFEEFDADSAFPIIGFSMCGHLCLCEVCAPLYHEAGNSNLRAAAIHNGSDRPHASAVLPDMPHVAEQLPTLLETRGGFCDTGCSKQSLMWVFNSIHRSDPDHATKSHDDTVFLRL